MLAFASANSDCETPDYRWAELEQWTLEACVLRAEGRETEAAKVLQDRLPGLIQRWSAATTIPKREMQERLRRLFADAQSFVTRGLAQRRLIAAELLAQQSAAANHHSASAPASSAPAARRAFGLRRSVPFHDIAGMLDGLAEAERDARREAIWPVRSPLTAAALSLA